MQIRYFSNSKLYYFPNQALKLFTLSLLMMQFSTGKCVAVIFRRLLKYVLTFLIESILIIVLLFIRKN
jgi:hypothetical protein